MNRASLARGRTSTEAAYAGHDTGASQPPRPAGNDRIGASGWPHRAALCLPPATMTTVAKPAPDARKQVSFLRRLLVSAPP